MRLSVKRLRLSALILAAVLLLGLPAAGLGAGQPQGFILLSAGKDGQIGTSDDLYATGKGDVVKGLVNLASLGLSEADLVPSNGPKAEEEPAFVPASVAVTADRASAPADGKTSIAITAEVRGRDGKPAPDGTEVMFSSTLGMLSTERAYTSGGLASARLLSDVSGVAEISASVGGRASDTIAVCFVSNIALSKPYRKSREPNPQYPDSLGREFTDGKLAVHYLDGFGFGYKAADLGVGPTDVGQLEITVDLGGEFFVCGAELYAGSDPPPGQSYDYRYGADVVEILTSSDGKDFSSAGSVGVPGLDRKQLGLEFPPVRARYVVFRIRKKFDWPYTLRDWLFLSEGRVYGCPAR